MGIVIPRKEKEDTFSAHLCRLQVKGLGFEVKGFRLQGFRDFPSTLNRTCPKLARCHCKAVDFVAFVGRKARRDSAQDPRYEL